ncbi:tRNA (adenosine(37)-N6)-dimethylallyltransferase MiaA [Longimicrobium sp.]|uniref:tRNA (adenosine(37)-N6)-dimethylallyltransferase MiaA n=1 Tax=Longimicrobium sp. TaxID=2029185 RepID=UPI003B3BD2BF
MPEALALVGPTGSGKTALSIEIARRIDGEIISMDSRAVYRGMDIGTAKATEAERGGIPHWGIDIAEPSERFNAARWAAYAREKMAEIRARGRVPMLVGGTGFFLRALTHPIFQEPELDPDRRARLLEWMERQTDAELHRWLLALDPESAERLRDWGGRQRLMRALEVPLLTGRTLPWWHRNSPAEETPVTVLPFVLEVPRDRLYAGIDRRVTEMVEAGLLDEVRGLVQKYGEDAPGLNAHAYIELFPYFRGERTLDEALDLARANTRAYTRRQLTWFRTKLPGGAVWLDATRPRRELADEIVAAWSRAVAEPASEG